MIVASAVTKLQAIGDDVVFFFFVENDDMRPSHDMNSHINFK